jgi:hypothetical protein
MTPEEIAYRERCQRVLAGLKENGINVIETVWVKGQLHINAVFGGTPKTLVVTTANPPKESKS